MFAYAMPFHDHPDLVAEKTAEDKAHIDALRTASDHAGLIAYLNRGSNETRYHAIKKLLHMESGTFPSPLKQPTLRDLCALMDRLAADISAEEIVLKAYKLGKKLGATNDDMKKNMIFPEIIDNIIALNAAKLTSCYS